MAKRMESSIAHEYEITPKTGVSYKVTIEVDTLFLARILGPRAKRHANGISKLCRGAVRCSVADGDSEHG